MDHRGNGPISCLLEENGGKRKDPVGVALLTVLKGQSLGGLSGYATQHQGAACGSVGDVLC